MSRDRPRLRVVGGTGLVQDAGRPGLAGTGVGRSGAADRAAYALGNRALGNREGAAALELVLGGLELVVEGPPGAVAWLCTSGAPAGLVVGDRRCAPGEVVPARTGERVRVEVPARGLRSYLAVRGGIDERPVLGSRSRDTLAGLGPAPVGPGRVLVVGDAAVGPVAVDVVPTWERGDRAGDGAPVLRVVRGPRLDHLADPDALVRTVWQAAAEADRVGVRLRPAPGGVPLRHATEGREVPSEGVLRGAVQVPPSGEPVLFGADHPVTGGYPVVGVLVDADADRAAQLRPGEPLHLRWA